MRNASNQLVLLIAALVLAVASSAHATQIQDLVRLKGSESNTLIGMGLVVGLKGTGDGGKFAPSMRALANTMGALVDDTVLASELTDARNVAMVYVSVKLPANGVREGDTLDVHVAAVAAKSLAGGRLIMTPLIHSRKDPRPSAFAEGALVIENTQNPTTARIERGAKMARDVWAQFYDEYFRITLVLENKVAGWPVAHYIANHINSDLSPDGPDIAKAIDGKNVVVSVPVPERANPSAFINRILTSYVDPELINTEARVTINEKTGTIVMTGDVRISPVIISHRGLTITTVTPEPPATPFNPKVEQNSFVLMDPDRVASPELTQLLGALNQLKVPTQDQIEIIKEIDRAGQLHAKLIFE